MTKLNCNQRTNKIDEYYPMGYNPIHPVQNWSYVRKIMRAVINGQKIPPILVDGGNLLAGTHRLMANNLLKELYPDAGTVDVIDLDDLEEEHKGAIMDYLEQDDYCSINEIWDGIDDLSGINVMYA